MLILISINLFSIQNASIFFRSIFFEALHHFVPLSIIKTAILELNVLNTPLEICCTAPVTGYFRDGFCKTREDDYGTHTVCAIVTEAFLKYSATKGNDLITPISYYNFPGLKPGDKWCLCVSRWLEAEKAGKAPFVILEATHIKSLQYTSLAVLEKYAFSE